MNNGTIWKPRSRNDDAFYDLSMNLKSVILAVNWELINEIIQIPFTHNFYKRLSMNKPNKD